MNRAALVSGIWILVVLSAGLSGCGPKAKEKDVYQVPGPKIIKGGQTVDYKAWDSLGSAGRTMDLNDAFDISEGSPVKAEVVSHCFQNQRDISQTFSFPGSASLKIFALLPDEVLPLAFSSEIQCSFELAVYNEIGSRHIFFIPSVIVQDVGPQQVSLLVNSVKIDKTSDTALVAMEAGQVTQVLYSNSGKSTADLFCTDVTFKSVDFVQVSNLSRFDVNQAKPRTGRPVDILRINSVQQCRVSISDDARRVAVSPSFQLAFPVTSLQPQIESLPYRTGTKKDFLAVSPSYGTNKSFTFSTLRMSNTGKGLRRVRIPKTMSKVRVFNFWQNEDRPYRLPFYSASAFLEIGANDKVIVYQDETAFDVTIPEGESIVLESRVWQYDYQICEREEFEVDLETGHHLSGVPIRWTMLAATYELVEKGTYQELSLAGEPIDTQSFQWGARMVLKLTPKTNIEKPIALEFHEYCH